MMTCGLRRALLFPLDLPAELLDGLHVRVPLMITFSLRVTTAC